MQDNDPILPDLNADALAGTVAIVGMSGRFPGAASPLALWDAVCAKRDMIRHFSDQELEDNLGAEVRGDNAFVKARPILENVDEFDAGFFGMLAREAALTDPQQRIFLECAWEAFEDCGCDPSNYKGVIGVFAGSSLNTYFLRHVLNNRAAVEQFTSNFQVGSYAELLGALQDFVSSRVAYKLDLRGPAVTVQSACSTSLLAVAQACQSLLLYQSDMALAGGVSITFPQKRGYLSLEGGMASSDGLCRPFDVNASGTVFGHGSGVVLLKRTEEALADGDHVYAIIRGFGVNNDGADKVGFTAPSVKGQASAISAAHAMAGIDAGTIQYVECHGTATPLGDPIELAALTEAFALTSEGRNYCAIGSVKGNVGHLDAAAGVTGLIVASIALSEKTMPPLNHFQAPNPHLNLASSPFYINPELKEWKRLSQPRRAGVSAFGVGGTNVHLVLEEAPERAHVEQSAAQPFILPVSAKTEASLEGAKQKLADFLDQRSGEDLSDVAFTLQTGRRAFNLRTAITARDKDEAVRKLRASKTYGRAAASTPSVVFMFPGQGSQYPGMGRTLYQTEAVFKAEMDRGRALFKELTSKDIIDLLYGSVPQDDDTPHPVRSTVLAQPALFLVENAMARLLMSKGVEPTAMIGHSLGEFVAACIAGVMSFEDALALIVQRGRLMQDEPGGAMLAVRLSESDLTARLNAGLEIAAVNAPKLCVASGSFEAVAALEESLTKDDIQFRRLHTSHAFHSAMMERAVAAFEPEVAKVKLSAPSLPYASCVTGQWITPEQATSPAYWAKHCRETVLFADCLRAVGAGKGAMLIEAGPGRSLSTFASQTLPQHGVQAILPSMPDFAAREDDDFVFAEMLGGVWAAGGTVDWSALGRTGRRISLPAYSFDRQRYWLDAPAAVDEKPTPNFVQEPQPQAEITEVDMPTEITVIAEPAQAANPSAAIQERVVALLEGLSGEQLRGVDPAIKFLELGFDSLFLGQFAQKLQKAFPIKITFRQLLGDYPSIKILSEHIASLVPASADLPVPTPAKKLVPAPQAAPVVEEKPDLPIGKETQSRFQMYRGASASQSELTARQSGFIADLIRRYNSKTPGSKKRTQENRRVLADPRSASGFRAEWKEIVYPLVCPRSKGSKIWDMDGNEYIDLVNGYGQTAFGHNPDFVVEAVNKQMQAGFAIGPQTPLAYEVAELFAEITGAERVTFCNTGSEAVMAAMRVARTVTGRSKVVVFAGAYHGQFDEVLVKAGRKSALPMAPGIPPESVGNVIVLPYAAPESLAWIEANAEDLAAVMVETVQSRHPSLQPRQFLSALREITEAAGTAFIFDEVVTGFRVHPGGMQALYGIQADMATYGKVVGGGMPIGVLAGKAAYMDALDGGFWSFGDDSAPEVAPTFFAGTFVRHPLVMAAAKSVLLHLKAEGPQLQRRLAEKTASMVARINKELAERGIATRAEYFSSWFYVNFSAEDPLASLFFHYMRLLGVNMQEGFPCFLTTAHTDAEIDFIVECTSQALDALQSSGILEGDRKAASKSHASRLPDEVALTEPQTEVWLSAQMGPEASCAFNESVSLRLEGLLDSGALTLALNDVIARHDALRACFSKTGRGMRIAPELLLTPPLVDLRASGNAEAEFETLRAEDAETPFDLANGPLVRAQLVRMKDTLHVFVLTAHHIVCDGWSINTLLEDIAACYRARVCGAVPELPHALSFVKYAMEKAAPSAAAPAIEAFWLDEYKVNPEPFELPYDRPRPALKSSRGATVTGTIDADLYMKVKKAGAKQGSTLFATLFAAMQTLIGRLAGQDDIALAVPMAGQSLLEGEILVGHCVNFLPVRVPCNATQPFSDHLAQVSKKLLTAYANQDYTLGTLVRKLGLPRSLNRTPITDVQFNLEKLSSGLSFPGLKTAVTPNPKAFVNFDLFFNMIESSDGIRIDVDYSTDLYDASTIERWIGHFREILLGIATGIARAVCEMPLLAAAEREDLLGLAHFAQSSEHIATVHGLFEAQAAKTPDAIAVSFQGHNKTYAELDAAANRLARYILSLIPEGSGRVAVAVNRSIDMVVALLAVMKAGHAYVPLDPRQPLVRLKQTLDGADVAAVICSSSDLLSILPDGVKALRLDEAATAIAELSAAVPGEDAASQGSLAAYVIFTSGSTGAPKGVEVSHGAVVNFLLSMAERPGFKSGDRIVSVTTISFDIAALELYLPLITGGQVTIASGDDVRDGLALLKLVEASRATVLQATPSLWRMLTDLGFRPRPGLKMLCGGEALPRDLANTLTQNGGELWNMYGPTETTIWSSVARIEPGDSPVVIGEPIANTKLYVLDTAKRFTAIGVTGDLWIGGQGLANGYFRRPDLTAAAFQNVVLEDGSSERLYRTGDVAKRLANGGIQLLGRGDRQIKLRGFRIELEDIEACLRTVPGVDACAVGVQETDGDKRLAAYYTQVAGVETAPAEIAKHLAERLPDYMVPVLWKRIEAMPLTPNGKLDRKALPQIDVAKEAATREIKLASNDMERKLAAIWGDVLKISPIGVDDQIFALGADSLHVARIAARMADQGITLEARHLMRNPTIAELAATATAAASQLPETVKTAPTLADFRSGAMRRKEKVS